MEYGLRPMVPSDYDQVLAVWQHCEGIGLTISDERPVVTAFLARNPELSMVATNPAGTIVGVVLAGHDGLRATLRHLAVLPGDRGRGLGRALVEHAIAKLRALGIHKCAVFIFADNVAGAGFWERIGWRERADLQIRQVVLTD